jgi:hypothetical protein
MTAQQTISGAKSFNSEWLPALAQSQGFVLDALETNRAGRYTEEQVQLIELRGRKFLNRKNRGAWGALGISAIGFLFTLMAVSLPSPRILGAVTGPGTAVQFTAPLISLVLLVIGSLVLRSSWRWWQSLRADLKQHKIACVEGQVTLKGPSLTDYMLISQKLPQNPPPDQFAYVVHGVSLRVDPQAWFAFRGAAWAECRFRVYYVPSCNWPVNMDPIV